MREQRAFWKHFHASTKSVLHWVLILVTEAEIRRKEEKYQNGLFLDLFPQDAVLECLGSRPRVPEEAAVSRGSDRCKGSPRACPRRGPAWLCEHYLHQGEQMDTFDRILSGSYIRILFSILNLQLQTHAFLMCLLKPLPYLIFCV